MASHLVIISRKEAKRLPFPDAEEVLYLKFLYHSCSFFIVVQIYDKKAELQNENLYSVKNSRYLILKAVFSVAFSILKRFFIQQFLNCFHRFMHMLTEVRRF